MPDIEVNLNSRPLAYIEHDIAHQSLIPNSIFFGRDVLLPIDLEVTSKDEGKLFRKRAKTCVKM